MDAEILTRRAEIARAIEGQTICGLLELAAREFAGRPALSASRPHPECSPAVRQRLSRPPTHAWRASSRSSAGRLLPHEWTSCTRPQARHRLRRRVIHASYADIIDELYQA